jgi:hypothetical protein
MSDADILAEFARQAQQEGCPADQGPKDLDAALIWLDRQRRADLEKLSDEEREELVTRYPDLGTGTR